MLAEGRGVGGEDVEVPRLWRGGQQTNLPQAGGQEGGVVVAAPGVGGGQCPGGEGRRDARRAGLGQAQVGVEAGDDGGQGDGLAGPKAATADVGGDGQEEVGRRGVRQVGQQLEGGAGSGTAGQFGGEVGA